MTTIEKKPLWTTTRKAVLAILLAVQFAIAYFVGTVHLLTNTGLTLFPPIAITVFVPVALFLTAYLASGRFRGFVLAQDLRTLTLFQLWRVVGFSFLLLYSFDVLPGLFAWPAGLGDVAIGLAAVVVVTRMDSDRDYVMSQAFTRFHLLGLLDFVVAIVTVSLASGAIPGLISNGLTSAPMDVWPLNLFPSFGVPIFIILQLSALLIVRDRRHRLAVPSTNLATVG